MIYQVREAKLDQGGAGRVPEARTTQCSRYAERNIQHGAPHLADVPTDESLHVKTPLAGGKSEVR